MDTELRAIADPTRREILALVRDRELPASEIAARFPISRPAVSQHLRTLQEAGLVSMRREGTRRYYRAEAERLTRIIRELEEMWDTALARLKRAAEAEEARRRGKKT